MCLSVCLNKFLSPSRFLFPSLGSLFPVSVPLSVLITVPVQVPITVPVTYSVPVTNSVPVFVPISVAFSVLRTAFEDVVVSDVVNGFSQLVSNVSNDLYCFIESRLISYVSHAHTSPALLPGPVTGTPRSINKYL